MNKDGPAVAAIFASAIGCAVIGVATILAEASPVIKNALTWWSPAGPLTGKTGVGVIVWLVSWGLLHLFLKEWEVPFVKFWRLSVVLIVIGLLGTFPLVFEFFAVPH